MPIPKSRRTPQVINLEINKAIRDKDKSASLFKKRLVVLTSEYDTAVGRENAQRKLDAMDSVEVEELKTLLKEGS